VPPGLTARPLRADDDAPASALLASAEHRDDTGEYPDAADMTEWWDGFGLDLERDGVAVCDAGGVLVAFATAMAPPTLRGDFSVCLEGRARPIAAVRASGARCSTGSSPAGPRSTPGSTPRGPGGAREADRAGTGRCPTWNGS
jgi:mycothiol synthase